MADGAAFQPGIEEVAVPFRPRGAYAGYRAFGSGDGAVLVEPQVARKLRSAAEFATQERRIAGGLLYGRGWADDQGAYLVVDGYLEAGPGENRDDRLSGNFTLSAADLRLLRVDAARMYSASLEAGWWRTLAALGEFVPQDFATQAELVGPDGVGLLVYGSGVHWGTAYLGPDGHAPDTAGTLVMAPDPAPAPPPAAGPEVDVVEEVVDVDGPPEPEVVKLVDPSEPEVVDLGAGESLARDPLPADAGAAVPPTARVRRRVRRRVTAPARAGAPVRVTTRRWRARPASPDYPLPETPADVQLVIVALSVAIVAAAIIVGVLTSSVIVAVVIAAVGLLAVFSTVWIQRR
jgi:hypothetical protein